ERHRVEREKEGRPEPSQEPRVGVRSLHDRPELPQIDHREEGHEDAGELPEDEARVGPLPKPPPHRHAAAIPAGMVQGVVWIGAHLALHGRSSDLTQWVAAVTLYC